MISRGLLLRNLPLQLRQTPSVLQALGRDISTACHLTDDQASNLCVPLSYDQVLQARSLIDTPHCLLTVPSTFLQLDFQKTARDFARKELLPHASKWDEKKHFPVETLRAAAQLGFAGLYIR